MALAMTERDELQVHVVHDERVAAFVALGLGLPPSHLVSDTSRDADVASHLVSDTNRDAGERKSGVPALLLCTSGTAAANFLPAIAEAGLSAVPMIVLTADRPEELRGVGAPQTIDQLELYGSHVRWFHDPGVPDVGTAGEWRPTARTAWTNSLSGPVHLNLPFREPLVGMSLALPDPDPDVDTGLDPAARHVEGSHEQRRSFDAAPSVMSSERGVILVGGMSKVASDRVLALQAATGWPLIADPQSGLRHVCDVTTIDSLLRIEGFGDDFLPDVIVRIGRPSASKVLAQWTARPEPVLIQVGGPGRIDPSGTVAAVCSIDDLIDAAGDASNAAEWTAAWHDVESVAHAAIVSASSDDTQITEPEVARVLVEHLPPDAEMTVSSSMPVRDVEWFGGRTPFVHSNRGANGIDGVISTALGRALGRANSESPSFVLIGDLAFVHDSNALVGLTGRGVDVRVVVVDNDGGGIFSFLPQSTRLDHDRFEKLFGTPLGTDVLALAAAHGLEAVNVTSVEELIAQIGQPGSWVCRVPSNRAANVTVHDGIHAAVAAAVRAR